MADVFKPTLKGKKSRTWYGKVHNPKSKKWSKVNLGVTDKQVARKLLRERQQREERIAAGQIDPARETPLASHLADFMRHLAQQDRNADYRVQTETEVIKAALFAAGERVPDRFDRKNMDAYRAMIQGLTLDVLTPDKLDEYLASLPATKAARTRNGYRTSVINLFNFLVEKRKLLYNPMLCVTRHEGEKKRQRRGLRTDQLQALFRAAGVRPVQQALIVHRGERKGQRSAALKDATKSRLEWFGHHRALIYLAAFYTGLRRGELRSLRVKHLQLDEDVAHVSLPGALTKNGKDAKLPLPSALVERLREWTRDKGPDDPVFRVPKHDELLKALKKDLAFAGIPYRDDQGRVFDFHSLRKSLGTHLRLAKVDPAVSQQFMRHGDIRLTMEVYNDDQLHDLRVEVVDKLPVFTL